MLAPQTNAKDASISKPLSAMLDEYPGGTLLSVIVTKVGETRGAGADKKVYGDDTTQVLIWTGFQYRALIERSQKKLRQRLDKGGVIREMALRAYQENPETLIEDACMGIQEMQEWFNRTMHGGYYLTEVPPLTGGNWAPLVIDGQTVIGCRVYQGPSRPDNADAPVPGTVYVQGVKLGEKVVFPAEHGEWKPKSAPKTIVKRLLKDELPIGRYVQYRLDPERCRDLKVGQEASEAAKTAGIFVDPEALRSLFKVAP